MLLSAGAQGQRPGRDRLYPVSLALSGSALATAADGTPHILYPSTVDWLRHTWREGDRWRDEAVEDEISTCGRRSIVVDGLGRPHIAYTARFLVYGVRTDAGWQLTEVATTIGDAAIAFRPGDRPALLHDAPNGNLELLYLDDEGVWTVRHTGLVGFVGNEPSLAFDSTGSAHLLFFRDFVLHHATDASGTWVETALSGAPFLTGALALDPQGRPHVAVGKSTTQPRSGLFHHWHDGSGWRSEEILPDGDSFPSRHLRGLHCDEAGHLFASYTDALYRGIHLMSYPRYAYHDGTRWRVGYSRLGPYASVTSAALASLGEIRQVCVASRLLLLTFSLPDLSAEWEAPGSLPEGEGLRARGTLRLRNLGAGRSRPTRVEFYLSDDDRLDEGDERVGAGRRLDGIRPGREREFAVSLALPAAAAGRRLLAVVDPAERRDDLDRPNNTAALLLGD